jgi:broad specificity phosphatase PhoE
MKVYIVRHGESQDLANNLFQRSDSPLTEVGLRQAKTVAKRFKDLEVDEIWSSPMKRAYQTAEAIALVTKDNIVVEPFLSEKKMPSEVEGKKKDDPHAREISKQIMENYHNPQFRHSDENTFEDIKYRAQQLKNMIIQKSPLNIVLVTHEIIAKALLSTIVMGDVLDSHIFRNFDMIFDLNKTGMCVLENTIDHRWRVITWNDQVHLGE